MKPMSRPAPVRPRQRRRTWRGRPTCGGPGAGHFDPVLHLLDTPNCIRPSHRSVAAFALLSLTLLAAPLRAHEVAEEIAGAARNFLASLSPDEKARAVFPLADQERRNWHLIPRERRGLPLKQMTPAQQHLAHGLLGAALSHRGYLQATTIMSLEAVLRELEQGRGPVRDAELYFFTIFGEPDPQAAWGWRVEGHHLSLNFVMAGGEVSVTPSVMGSNPGEVREGPRAGLRVLADEEDLGRELLRSLDAEQRAQCVFSSSAPPDFILGPDRQAALLEPRGLGAARMNAGQQATLRRLVEAYVRRYRAELAAKDLDRIGTDGWDKLSFAWAGSLEPGKGCYYRVQGPSFVIEFDNTQNNANHIHTLWRDLRNDFGEDLLRRHYEQSPHDGSTP